MQTTIADVGALFIALERAPGTNDPIVIAALINGRAKLASLLARVDNTLARAGVTMSASATSKTTPATPKAHTSTPLPTPLPRPVTLLPVPLTARLAVLARDVPSFDDVAQDGNLYWVAAADCFAFRIAGMLMHGNIGTIYASARDGHKVIPCHYGQRCNRRATCQYWHNPLTCGGNERRNWTALSWMHGPRHGMRRIGNRASLEEDVTSATPADARDLRLQAMHDLLCAIVTTSLTGDKN